jgi:tetratricopeptide (TPR) repeat protein
MNGEVLELDGQYALDLGDGEVDIEALLLRAEEAEMEEDFDYAERLYRIALKLDPLNPLTAFNLGNAVEAQERKVEARHFWHLALEIDPWLPEACFNLALSAEEAQDRTSAIALYRRALTADADYADAAYNLGMLLYEMERYAEALPFWERFLRLDPNARESSVARRHAAECRLRARIAAGVRGGGARPRA